MPKSTINQTILLATLLALGLGAAAQQGAPDQGAPKAPKPGLEVPLITPGPGWQACPRCKNEGYIVQERKAENVDKRPFNAHDIAGVWSGNPEDLEANGTLLDLKNVPSLTPYGQRLFDALQSDSPQWNSKDPMNICDPFGWPRWLTYNYGFEFVVLPNRVMQFFEQGHTWRDIWTDGRKLPSNPPIPRYLGYAVGRWEGDTFFVESNGYDDRSWLTNQVPRGGKVKPGGYPHSDEMRVEERYKRLNYGLLQLTLTIIDPKVYTAPWTTTATVTLIPNSEIAEHFCVTSDNLYYNQSQEGTIVK